MDATAKVVVFARWPETPGAQEQMYRKGSGMVSADVQANLTAQQFLNAMGEKRRPGATASQTLPGPSGEPDAQGSP